MNVEMERWRDGEIYTEKIVGGGGGGEMWRDLEV